MTAREQQQTAPTLSGGGPAQARSDQSPADLRIRGRAVIVRYWPGTAQTPDTRRAISQVLDSASRDDLDAHEVTRLLIRLGQDRGFSVQTPRSDADVVEFVIRGFAGDAAGRRRRPPREDAGTPG